MGITEDQIEKAARAICQKLGHSPDTLHQAMPGDDWDKWPEDSHFVNSRGERVQIGVRLAKACRHSHSRA